MYGRKFDIGLFAMRFFIIPLIILACTACAAQSNTAADPEPAQGLGWRIASLEQGFMELQEEQARQSREVALLAQAADSRFTVLEARVDAVQAEQEEPAKPQTAASAKDLSQRIVAERVTKPAPTRRVATKPTPAKPAAKETAPERTHVAEAATPAKKLYDKALELTFAEDWRKARPLWKEFIATYQDHELIPNALYWMAETYYDEKDYTQAILGFRDVARRFPDHHKTPDALLKIGFSYERLNDVENARFYLRTLLDEYPGSDPAPLAKQKLDQLR
jgi:tol-pal system protein YbgF